MTEERIISLVNSNYFKKAEERLAMAEKERIKKRKRDNDVKLLTFVIAFFACAMLMLGTLGGMIFSM